MPSLAQMESIYYLSDTKLYSEAVTFIRRLVNEEDCMPLPASQVNGLLNIANASSYTELDRFMKHQCERNWPASKKDIKTFYTELDKIFTTMKNKRLREDFQLVQPGQNNKETSKEIEELMVFLARDFIQHLLAENALLAVAKAAERAAWRGRG